MKIKLKNGDDYVEIDTDEVIEDDRLYPNEDVDLDDTIELDWLESGNGDDTYE